jgi:chemotaxis protein MotA
VGGPGKVSVEELAGRLRKTPLARMAFGQLAELFTDMGELARRQGVAALGLLVKVVDEPLLKRGLEMVLDSRRPDAIIEALESQLDEEIRQAQARQQMVIAGIAAVQMGDRPVVVEEKVRKAAQ